jgi:hypothetical protein
MFAFTPTVLRYWGVGNPATDGAADAASLQLFDWRLRTGGGIGLCLFYSSLAWPAVGKARKGTLGKGADGKPARLGTGEWWYMQVRHPRPRIGLHSVCSWVVSGFGK